MKCATHDTLGLPLRQQVRHWQDATDHYFGPLQAQAFCDGPFDARLTACEAGSLRLLTIDAPAHRVLRDHAASDPRHDSFKLLLQIQGVSEIRQRDASFSLQPGDWSLYDPREPYTITSPEPIRHLVVQIPREKLGHLPVGSLHTCEADAPELLALYEVLSSFLGALAAQLRTLPDAVGAPLSETTLGLLAQALQAQRGEAPERVPLPEVMRARVRQYIHAHLTDPDLTVERIAHDMRCSKRYLHSLFQGEAHTLDRQIWLARLERCRQGLATGDASTISISALAYRWGFNSNAHFSRMFKREFDTTPSEFLKRRVH
ncbi:helix-turn-helix domain-containing protein [Ramlibacter sp. WS9]|uniref:AraC-like ligand-binding domain-containing protein n=1 Tax=Ramlibacter sp. WS9 TaxID=1882741 RepID=UPI0013052D99|nr:helix-turn-helix domain-containing protein [Ramlibacter sp. WS9]